MQINRLFQIIYILLDRKMVTAKYLSEKLEVSIRTIYRDIDALSLAGIPIYTSKGKNGGIGILDNFVLNKSLLSESDQNEILIGLQSLKATRHIEVGEITSKLSNLFKKTSLDWIEVDFSSWGNNDEKKKFDLIKTAIINSQVIEFDYFSSSGLKSRRKIEPLRLCFKDKAWYIQCYCLLRRDYRTFKITRISGINVLDEFFEREIPEDLSIEPSEEKLSEMIHLKLLFSPHIAYRVYDEFSPESMKANSDGSIEATVSFPRGSWIIGYILSFGSFVEVLEPREIREAVLEELKKTINNYL